MLKVFTSFTGIGSQEMALKNIGVDFTMVGISEVDRYALLAYDAIHNDQTLDFVYPSKEEMLKEFDDKHIAYNFSTNESEIPKNIEDIKKLYRAHINSKNFGDIRLIDEKKLPDFDFFSYSFPCKNISVAGRGEGLKKGSETQSSLVWECERIIKEKKPKYLLMENVKNIVGQNNIKFFKLWIGVLTEMGYTSYWKVLNGKDYGVPQNRERVMMISINDSVNIGYTFPKKMELNKKLKDVLEPNVDEKYFIDDDKVKEILENFNLKGKVNSVPLRYLKRNQVNCPEDYSMCVDTTNTNGIAIQENDDASLVLPNQDISYCIDANYYKGGSGGAVKSFVEKNRRQLVQVGNMEGEEYYTKRVYDPIGISPALTSMGGGDRQPKIFNKTRVRRLTPLECWRLMGYKDEDYYKAKDIGGLSETKLYERAGRGIVVPMLEKLFENLFMKQIKGSELF